MAIILGFECLVIDSASLYSASGTNAESFLNPVGIPSANTREWRPKEWFPWAFLSAGAVSYTHLTLPTSSVMCRSRWWAGR